MHVVCPITRIVPLISVTTIALGTTPIHILRPLLFRLVQDGVLPRVHSRLLQALQRTTAEDYLIPNLRLDSSISPYASFRESIVRQLFGSDALLRLRLKFAIADFCWVTPSLPSFTASAQAYWIYTPACCTEVSIEPREPK
jgi:hypothetical protein